MEETPDLAYRLPMETKNTQSLSNVSLRPVTYTDLDADTSIARARRAVRARGIRRVRGYNPRVGARVEIAAKCTWHKDGTLRSARTVTCEDLVGLAGVLAPAVKEATAYRTAQGITRSAFAVRGWAAGTVAGRETVAGDGLAALVCRLLLDKHPRLHGASYVSRYARGMGTETAVLALAGDPSQERG